MEDYYEENFADMIQLLKDVNKLEKEVDDIDVGQHWFDKRETLYRFLKKYTGEGTEAKRIVTSVKDDNGWEAWRNLNAQ